MFSSHHAEEVRDEVEVNRAINFIYKRKNEASKQAADFTGSISRRMYRAIPEKVWINTDGQVNDHHIDARIEVNLPVTLNMDIVVGGLSPPCGNN